MNDEEYNELKGRIQGLTDVIFTLVQRLDHSNIIDAADFSSNLKTIASNRDLRPDLESAREQITHVAELIDEHRASMEGLQTGQ